MEESVINSIWERAMDFFPKLREHSLADFIERREVRVGLRPYSEFSILNERRSLLCRSLGLWDVFILQCLINKCIDVSVPDGKPVIGPVPGLSNVLLATGHEGGGLSMVNMLSYSSEDDKKK